MSLTWETIDRLARRNDRAALIRLLASATPAERAAAAPVVEAGVKALPADPGMDARTVYALAVAGTAPSAARAATVLRRPALNTWNRDESALFRTLAEALNLPWIGDLGAEPALPAAVAARAREGVPPPAVVAMRPPAMVAMRPPAMVAMRPPAVAAMPPPIADAAEFAEELAALVHDQTAVGWERVLAALVALHTDGDRETLAATLLPVIERYAGWFEPSRWNAGSPLVSLGLAIRSATGPAGRGGNDPTRRELAAAVRVAWQEGRRGHPHSPLSPQPDGVLALRVAEVAVHLTGSMVPMIVATPTHVNGSVDAGVLLQRLQRAEAEGWQPWPFDFEQALLRVPRGAGDLAARAVDDLVAPQAVDDLVAARSADDLVAARAARLTSPAGRQFAQWLSSGGLPDPISAPVTKPGERGRDGGWTWDAPVPRRIVATLRPARDGGLRLERQLLTLTPVEHPVYLPGNFEGTEDILAMVLPHHREAAAAWALADVASPADQNQRNTARNLFPLLAECTGPVGPAVAYALAYALAAEHEPDRAAAVDMFLTLAATRPPTLTPAVPAAPAAREGIGDSPGEGASFASLVGTALADLGGDGTIRLTRVLPALAGMHRAGASVAVWELLVAALPPLLTTTVRTVPDLLELASQVAVTLGVTGELIPGLAEAAARPGSTRVTKEAKRLRSILEP
ncbi:hypothetical protein AB0F72_22700 [Actinoplanes sp. NPDC023936]|uniref:hypothetical protein n=1 Tax=Actinoplanes sp. NPDC023936 TaxID=3154910 RepID=UPI0033F9FFD2